MKRWVYVSNGTEVDGAFSLYDVVTAWQAGIIEHKKNYPEHNRAILFTTTQAFQTYFGDQAGRIQTNGRTCFTDGHVGTYNSEEDLYIGEPQSLGQVDSDGCFDSSEVNPAKWKDVEVHGAKCIRAQKGPEIQIIIIVDAVGVLKRADTDNCMPITECLIGKKKRVYDACR